LEKPLGGGNESGYLDFRRMEGSMEGGDALGMIAEVGIAIAGFAGVVAALRALGGKIGPYAAMRIGNLFAYCAGTVVLALLPFGLSFGGLPP